ncbi:MAG: clostripain-related cysteine peptidase [Pseudobdellovibrionaceae bacterium]
MRSKLLKGALAASFVMGFALTTFAGPAKQQEKDWTVIVFLNGHNNLDPYGTEDINEMEKVGSTDKVNVVVQWASMDANTKRLLVQKDNNEWAVTSPIVQDMGIKIDMGDYKELVNFANWAIQNYPAKRYFIDVWNHGSGWHRFQLNSRGFNIKPMDISWDDNTGNSISTEQLGVAMSEIALNLGRKVDIYGSDACLMSMVEVGAEMADSADVMIGSQDLEPGDGWDYEGFLNALAANPTTDALEVGKMLVQTYSASYPYTAVTLSAVDLRKFGGLLSSLRRFSTEIMSFTEDQKPTIQKAMDDTENFFYSDYKDMGMFLEKLAASGLRVETLTEVTQAYRDTVYFSSATGNMSYATGLSIWMPSATDYGYYWNRYSKLKSEQASGWGQALGYILK